MKIKIVKIIFTSLFFVFISIIVWFCVYTSINTIVQYPQKEIRARHDLVGNASKDIKQISFYSEPITLDNIIDLSNPEKPIINAVISINSETTKKIIEELEYSDQMLIGKGGNIYGSFVLEGARNISFNVKDSYNLISVHNSDNTTNAFYTFSDKSVLRETVDSLSNSISFYTSEYTLCNQPISPEIINSCSDHHDHILYDFSDNYFIICAEKSNYSAGSELLYNITNKLYEAGVPLRSYQVTGSSLSLLYENNIYLVWDDLLDSITFFTILD